MITAFKSVTEQSTAHSLCAKLIGFSGICLLTIFTPAFASSPPPRQVPPAQFNGTVQGVDLSKSWNDMLTWTRTQAWSVVDATLALSRTSLNDLPRNIWTKSVVINFADLGFLGRRPNVYAFYEAENCTKRTIAKGGLGGAGCNWNLRVVEIIDMGWFEDTPPPQMGFPENASINWVNARLKPDVLGAQFRASKATSPSVFAPDWSAFGDPKTEVKANAIKVTLFKSAACPQVITGLVRLGNIARARNPANLLDGPFPQMPPAGIQPRRATLYLGARGNGADLTPATTETQAGFVNQVNEEIKRVKANCFWLAEQTTPP